MKAQTTLDLALLRRQFAPLRAGWARYAKRIDALSLRERAFLFLSIVALLGLLFDSLVLAPQSARAKLRTEAQAKEAAEITQLREQFIAASRESDGPAGQLGRQLDEARTERTRLDTELRQAASGSGGDGLPVVLQRLLAQQPGLVLEKVALLDDTPVTAPTAASAAAPAAPRPLPIPGMSWQGVELQVQGSYRDTLRYLQALERELPGLRWGEMKLNSNGAGEPPRLVAQVFLLRVQP